jgi:hypothetical protein
MKDVNVLFGMVDHRNVEAMAMRWRKCDLWKAGIVIVGMLLLLTCLALLPLSAASAHEETSRLVTLGTPTVQATPTEDATVTALNKEKLAQEVQHLKGQNEPDFFGWLQGNATLLSTLLVVVGGLIGLWRWFADRGGEREKRAEERFQSVVEGLGSERTEIKVGAAIMLHTFLQKGYERFYRQAFDLTVTHLRLLRTSDPPKDPNTPLPLATLNQALIAVFTEAFPLARDELKKRKKEPFDPRSLGASHIKLDNAFLWKADLEQVWMPGVSLRKTDLTDAKLGRACVWGGAKLTEAKLERADLSGADLSGADLSQANLSQANLSGADLSGANLEDALSLKDTNLRRVKGLTKEQLAACQAKGAIIDEDPATNSSQPTAAPLQP